MPDPVRTCAWCGAPLVQRASEAAHHFKRRQSCNFGCGAHLGHKRAIERAAALQGIDLAELARRDAAGLCSCGKPKGRRSRGGMNKTCGSPACAGIAGVRVAPVDAPHWPKVTGPVVADFSAQNIKPKDGGFGFKIIRADDRSYVGCALR